VLTDPRYRERVAGLREELDAYDPLAIVDAALAADGILPAEIAA
jgi:hypothetical protein